MAPEASRIVDPAGLLKAVRLSSARISRDLPIEAAPDLGPISCTKGCAFCCYQKTICTIAWGAIIYLQLKEEGVWGGPMCEYLVAANRHMTEASHGDFVTKRIPCPFLAEEGRGLGRGSCRIYSVRPLGCLTTLASTEDPSTCATLKNGSQRLLPSPVINRWVDRLSKQIAEDLDQRHLDLQICTLPGAVLVAHSLVEGTPPPDVWSIDLRSIPPAILTEQVAFAAYIDSSCRRFVSHRSPARW